MAPIKVRVILPYFFDQDVKIYTDIYVDENNISGKGGHLEIPHIKNNKPFKIKKSYYTNKNGKALACIVLEEDFFGLKTAYLYLIHDWRPLNITHEDILKKLSRKINFVISHNQEVKKCI